MWRRVEEKVCEALGLKRVAYSGGIWPNKEDGEDIDYIMQVKTTHGKEIRVTLNDINQITKRANIQQKIPLYVIHFDGADYELGKTWVAVPIEHFRRYGKNGE